MTPPPTPDLATLTAADVQQWCKTVATAAERQAVLVLLEAMRRDYGAVGSHVVHKGSVK